MHILPGNQYLLSDMTQEKCTSVGLSALPVGYYMARAYMEDGRVQVCKIMK